MTVATDMPATPALTPEEAAKLLGVKPATLAVWRSTGRYAVPYYKVGRNVRYSREELLAWREARKRT